MAYVCSFLWLLSSFGLDKSVALIIEGKLSGSKKGYAIAHIIPEAAEGGLITVVERVDIIAINIPNRELNIRFFRSVEPAPIKKSK